MTSLLLWQNLMILPMMPIRMSIPKLLTTAMATPATHIMRLYTHGRFLITLEGSVSDTILSQVPVNTVMVEGFQRLLDQFMAPVFRPEIQSS